MIQRWFPSIHIVRDPESGEPVLEASRVLVRMVVEHELGRRHGAVCDLNWREIRAARRYYQEHKAEIDAILEVKCGRVVLLVELTEHNEQLVSRTLGRLGYTVITAATAAEGIAQIQTNQPGLIILQGEPGIETCTALKKVNISIPSILLDRSSNDRQIWKRYAAGIDASLSLPFNPLELTSFVERIFRSLEYSDAFSDEAG